MKNDGNFEGEASNQPGASSVFGDYPEIFTEARHFPTGRFDDFQRHKVRVMGIYTLGLGRAGSVDLSGVVKFNSALTYSLRSLNVPLTDIQQARLEAAGYASLPNAGVQTLFYGERGSETFKGYGLVDFGAQYSIPVWATLRPYVKLDALNLFNNQKQIGWNTAVTPDWKGPLDELGLPLNCIKGSNFGKPNAQGNYPLARPGLAGGRIVPRGLRVPLLARPARQAPHTLRQGATIAVAPFLCARAAFALAIRQPGAAPGGGRWTLDVERNRCVYTYMARHREELSEYAACACFALRRSARVITQHYDHSAPAVGTAGDAVHAAHRAGARRTVAAQSCRGPAGDGAHDADPQSQALLAENLVEVRQEDDRRVRTISITDKGHRAAVAALPHWRKAQQGVATHLTARTFASLDAVTNSLPGSRTRGGRKSGTDAHAVAG